MQLQMHLQNTQPGLHCEHKHKSAATVLATAA